MDAHDITANRLKRAGLDQKEYIRLVNAPRYQHPTAVEVDAPTDTKEEN